MLSKQLYDSRVVGKAIPFSAGNSNMPAGEHIQIGYELFSRQFFINEDRTHVYITMTGLF